MKIVSEFHNMIDQYMIVTSIKQTLTKSVVENFLDQIANITSKDTIEIQMSNIITKIYVLGYTHGLAKAKNIVSELQREQDNDTNTQR